MTAPAPLGRRMAVASMFAVLQRLIMRSIGLISTLILVRLLSPEDFGIVSVAEVVREILNALTATGFGLALIRMREPERVHYDTAFTLTVLRGVLIAVLLVATADLQVAFMGEPRIGPVMWVMALTAILQSLENVRLIDLHRELRYDVILRYEVLKKGLSFLVVLPLAFWFRNYWALVLGIPLVRVVLTPISYWFVPYRPGLSLGAWKELFNFSKWLFLNNICQLFEGQTVNVAVGRVQGMAAVGLYQVGYQVAALPISELAAPTRLPSYAGFARVWQDRPTLGRYVLTALALQWVVILPLSGGIAVTAPEIIRIFLGARWEALIPLIPMIAWFALLNSAREYLQNVFIVLNRQAMFVLVSLLFVPVRVAAVLYGTIHYGLSGAVVAMLVTSLLNAALWLLMAGRMLALGPAPIIAALWRPSVATALMSAAVLAAPLLPGLAAAPITLLLTAKVAVGAIVYTTTVIVLWFASGRPEESAEAHLLRLVLAGLWKIGLGRVARLLGPATPG